MSAELARVLVVDDDDKIRELFSDLLDGRYEVETCGNPIEALDAVRKFQPHIVVLDYNMPEMNGMEVLRHIKATAPATQVIMVTGVAEVQLAEDAFHFGAFAYLPKPFQLPYAEHLILTALQQRAR
jgi:DNA-binding NtrC family response regulator